MWTLNLSDETQFCKPDVLIAHSIGFGKPSNWAKRVTPTIPAKACPHQHLAHKEHLRKSWVCRCLSVLEALARTATEFPNVEIISHPYSRPEREMKQNRLVLTVLQSAWKEESTLAWPICYQCKASQAFVQHKQTGIVANFLVHMQSSETNMQIILIKLKKLMCRNKFP